MTRTTKYASDDRGVATITFDRDAKRNAFDTQMACEVVHDLERAEKETARLVVIRANSDVKVWCAGHDLSELAPQSLYVNNPIIEVIQKIQSLPLPVIAMVEGSVHAGGLLILLGADMVIASENAEVSITSNKIGIPLAPEVYSLWLAVMGIHKAKELLFTATAISPHDAYHAGLYNRVVPSDALERVTDEVANRILECSAEAIANTKHQLNLIATRSALSDEDRVDIQDRSAAMLHGPDIKARIASLLASLRV